MDNLNERKMQLIEQEYSTAQWFSVGMPLEEAMGYVSPTWLVMQLVGDIWGRLYEGKEVER